MGPSHGKIPNLVSQTILRGGASLMIGKDMLDTKKAITRRYHNNTDTNTDTSTASTFSTTNTTTLGFLFSCPETTEPLRANPTGRVRAGAGCGFVYVTHTGLSRWKSGQLGIPTWAENCSGFEYGGYG